MSQTLWLLVMSSSWNFLSWAEPSWKGSELSQAKLGHFNFRAETELTICMSISSKFFACIMITTNYNQFYHNISEFKYNGRCFQSWIFMIYLHDLIKNAFSIENQNFGSFSLNFDFGAEWKRSWAEPSWKTFSLSYGLSKLGSVSSLMFILYAKS